jgi:hypothetical protein
VNETIRAIRKAWKCTKSLDHLLDLAVAVVPRCTSEGSLHRESCFALRESRVGNGAASADNPPMPVVGTPEMSIRRLAITMSLLGVRGWYSELGNWVEQFDAFFACDRNSAQFGRVEREANQVDSWIGAGQNSPQSRFVLVADRKASRRLASKKPQVLMNRRGPATPS